MQQRIDRLYYIIIPLLLLGVYFSRLVFLPCLIAIILRMLFSDRHTSGFYLLIYGGPLGGLVRTIYPGVPVYGLLLEFLGIYLLSSNRYNFFAEKASSMKYLFVLYALFIVSYLSGVQTSFAYDKLYKIIFHGCLLFYGYYIFDQSKEISSERLCQLLLMTSILMFSFVEISYSISPGSIFNYNWFREACSFWQKYDNMTDSHMLVSYQTIGVNTAFALTAFLSQQNITRNKIFFYTLLCSQLTLTTSARQAILAIVVVVALRLVYFREDGNLTSLGKIVGALAFLAFAYYFLDSFGGDIVGNTMESGDEGREIRFAEAIRLFMWKPLFGVGIGGYSYYVGFANFPHNMFLEILAECGLIGLFIVIGTVFAYMLNHKIAMKHKTANGTFLFLFMVSLFIRVMVSADLSTSIELFSALFAANTCNKMA